MSTRTTLIIKGKKKGITFYKHSDGYPTNILGLIAEVLGKKPNTLEEFAKAFEELEGERFEREFTDFLGNDFPKSFFRNNSQHADIEWLYIIDTVSKRVEVYSDGGEYLEDGGPLELFSKGTVDPLSYVKCLIESYQKGEEKIITKGMEAINSCGYSINGEPLEAGELVHGVITSSPIGNFPPRIKAFKTRGQAEKYFLECVLTHEYGADWQEHGEGDRIYQEALKNGFYLTTSRFYSLVEERVSDENSL